MKTRLILLMSLAIFMAFAMGCAGYNTRRAVPNMGNVPKDRLVQMENNGIAVTAFPILAKEDSKKYFDENLQNDGIFVAYLWVFNKIPDANVEISSIELKMGDTAIAPVKDDAVSSKIKREYLGKAYLWGAPTLYVGIPFSFVHTYAVNKKIEEDVKDKQLLADKEIEPFETAEGFIWFELPDKKSLGNGTGKLSIKVYTSFKGKSGSGIATYELPINFHVAD